MVAAQDSPRQASPEAMDAEAVEGAPSSPGGDAGAVEEDAPEPRLGAGVGEEGNAVYSPYRWLPDGWHRGLRVAVMAPEGAAGAVPTVLAISGEAQRHVSAFFRAWRAEGRGWQVVVPTRGADTPLLFEDEGLDHVVALMQRLVAPGSGEGASPKPEAPEAGAADVLPLAEGGKLHLVGTSNGGASVLAAALRAPLLVASLSLVTGFAPEGLGDLAPLRAIPCRLFAGDQDECGHDKALERLKEQLEEAGCAAELTIFPGARHMNIGHFLDMELFWRGLEAARCHEAA